MLLSELSHGVLMARNIGHDEQQCLLTKDQPPKNCWRCWQVRAHQRSQTSLLVGPEPSNPNFRASKPYLNKELSLGIREGTSCNMQPSLYPLQSSQLLGVGGVLYPTSNQVTKSPSNFPSQGA